jgi:hypothetical protein
MGLFVGANLVRNLIVHYFFVKFSVLVHGCGFVRIRIIVCSRSIINAVEILFPVNTPMAQTTVKIAIPNIDP